MTAVFKLVFLVFMGAGVPVAIAMAAAVLLFVLLSGNAPPFVVIHRMVGGIDSFPLLAVPFFILAGNLMNVAGITTRIYNFSLALVGWLRGGLAHVNIVGSVIFAGMSGTAIADAAGLGTIEIKAMKDHGYSTEFAVGVTAASATLGPIIPPSLPFVIYAMFANVSVGQLFLAGIVPGAVMALLMMLTVAWFARRNGWGRDTQPEWRRIAKALAELAVVVAFPFVLWALSRTGVNMQLATALALAALLVADRFFRFDAVLPIMTPVLLIGGMTSGLFTATEGAIAACVWALFLGLVWYRTLSLKTLVKACMETVETSSTVLFIVAAASIFGWMLTATRTTELIAQWVLTFATEPWQFLLLANALMLFVGCFLEPTAAITILVPILLPIVQHLGIDPVHFGLVMVLNLMIGLLHPPMGLVLFVLARVAKLSVERTTMAILPWLVPLLGSLALVTFVPAISLWLPRLLS
ncbi:MULTISPECIES: TRAP transporter large permease [unclassified Rhizobacter]|uniref:TRAP transporter large permease n=1 Tax=unclassified Rhizobacter TaxID=2640088 RepID=UPI0006FE0868|nr:MULTISPECIES: TRAP transporter large permease [unclassified Rhizobacter]KQU81513.1 ABC transporter permease [Rhizobacter sp. Root29]KQW12157.1 ABC transporter permease [Rhizobacter sp. Root1238]KRB02972.1 ABC transporter permease [Rhizobacter sp. Root16D2]